MGGRQRTTLFMGLEKIKSETTTESSKKGKRSKK